LLGLDGIRVERPEEIGGAWDSALAADRPTVLDVLVDPNVPPLPPHITSDQAEAMAKSLLKGDPDRIPVLRQTFRDLVEDFVPQR
jgi:pyruvate dehydrogenase (quinone)